MIHACSKPACLSRLQGLEMAFANGKRGTRPRGNTAPVIYLPSALEPPWGYTGMLWSSSSLTCSQVGRWELTAEMITWLGRALSDLDKHRPCFARKGRCPVLLYPSLAVQGWMKQRGAVPKTTFRQYLLFAFQLLSVGGSEKVLLFLPLSPLQLPARQQTPGSSSVSSRSQDPSPKGQGHHHAAALPEAETAPRVLSDMVCGSVGALLVLKQMRWRQGPEEDGRGMGERKAGFGPDAEGYSGI